MIELSKRLQAVADLAGEGERLIDIGTDHGYIPLYLIESGRMREAIACDVRPGPLARAEEHIALYGQQEHIATRLSDGLAKVTVEEAAGAVIVMAGMGGALIRQLISAKPEVAAATKRLVLQPQSEWPQFRGWLRGSGFVIEQECLLEEDGKWYLCFAGAIRPSQLSGDKVNDPVAEHYGEHLFVNQRGELLRFLEKEAQTLTEILHRLPPKGAEGRRIEVENLLYLNRAAVERAQSVKQ